MTRETEIKKKAQDLYRNLGWPSLFAKLKFYFAPFIKLEKLIPKEGVIVDLGCGYGLFSHYIGIAEPKRTVLGFDLNREKTKYGDRGYSNVSCRYGDITKVEIPPADCIVFIHVLHHLPSHESQKELLITCKNKLKDGGTLLIAEVGERPLWKHFLCYIADRILYPQDKLHYRTNSDMVEILSVLFKNVQVIPMDEGTAFSHITYLCRK
jgi:2-polyprenyl-3-methyl-5-hydroxy-6-metoxy-1,4-benzoquinol methylase